MISDRKMTNAEVDAWLYGELSKSGQKAWRMIYGLPKLLRSNPDKGHDAERDNDNPSADCNFKK